MPNEFRIIHEGVAPHERHFLWRVAKSGTEAEAADTEAVVPVVDSDAESGFDFVSHELFFLFEGVFIAGAVELGAFDGADGDYGECWGYISVLRWEYYSRTSLSFRATLHTFQGRF